MLFRRRHDTVSLWVFFRGAFSRTSCALSTVPSAHAGSMLIPRSPGGFGWSGQVGRVRSFIINKLSKFDTVRLKFDTELPPCAAARGRSEHFVDCSLPSRARCSIKLYGAGWSAMTFDGARRSTEPRTPWIFGIFILLNWCRIFSLSTLFATRKALIILDIIIERVRFAPHVLFTFARLRSLRLF